VLLGIRCGKTLTGTLDFGFGILLVASSDYFVDFESKQSQLDDKSEHNYAARSQVSDSMLALETLLVLIDYLSKSLSHLVIPAPHKEKSQMQLIEVLV
jgi:hypothetical protein